MNAKAKKETQVEKFKEAAREAEADEDEAAFEDKLRRLAKQKPDKPDKGKGKDKG